MEPCGLYWGDRFSAGVPTLEKALSAVHSSCPSELVAVCREDAPMQIMVEETILPLRDFSSANVSGHLPAVQPNRKCSKTI